MATNPRAAAVQYSLPASLREWELPEVPVPESPVHDEIATTGGSRTGPWPTEAEQERGRGEQERARAERERARVEALEAELAELRRNQR